MAVSKFKVPQKDGEIVISGATGEPLVFPVTDHVVTIRDDNEAAIFADRAPTATGAPLQPVDTSSK